MRKNGQRNELFTKRENTIITGDFNAKNELWGLGNENRRDNRGAELEDIMDTHDIRILNTGENTCFPPKTATKNSAIDLTFITPGKLENMASWGVHNNLCGSDHKPQIITIKDKIENNYIPVTQLKFKMLNADWDKYKTTFDKDNNNFEKLVNEDIDIWTQNIIDQFHKVGKETLKNNNKHLNKSTPPKTPQHTNNWWNEELNTLKKDRNRAQRKWLSDQSNPELTREYKISQTKYRSAVQKAKRKSFENFIQEINIHQNPKKAWKNINAMKGNIQNTKIDHLIVNDNKTVTDDKNSEILANQYYYVSSNNNINPNFLANVK